MQQAVIKTIETFARKLFNDSSLVASIDKANLQHADGGWKMFRIQRDSGDFLFFHFREDLLRDTKEFVRLSKLTLREMYKLHKEHKR